MIPRFQLHTASVAAALALLWVSGALAAPPPPPSPPPVPTPNFTILKTCWGGVACVTAEKISIQLNDALFLAAMLVAGAIFLVGAFMMVISAGNDQILQNAKRAMKYSLIGLAIIVGSYGIYRTAVFLLYP